MCRHRQRIGCGCFSACACHCAASRRKSVNHRAPPESIVDCHHAVDMQDAPCYHSIEAYDFAISHLGKCRVAPITRRCLRLLRASAALQKQSDRHNSKNQFSHIFFPQSYKAFSPAFVVILTLLQCNSPCRRHGPTIGDSLLRGGLEESRRYGLGDRLLQVTTVLGRP